MGAFGGLMPRRPDQRSDPPSMVVAPGGAAGTFRGKLVLVFTKPGVLSGVFIFDAAGKLIASMAGQGGTVEGDTYLTGIVSYEPSTGKFTQVDAGDVQFGSQNPATTITNTGTVSLIDALAVSGQPGLIILSPLALSGTRGEIQVFSDSQDGSLSAKVVIKGVPLFVQGALTVTTGGAAVTGGTATDTLAATGQSSLASPVLVGATGAPATNADLEVHSLLALKARAAPGTPPAGYGYLYVANTGNLHYKGPGGTDTSIASS